MCKLQSADHTLNETSLAGLDIVVEEARLAGLKLILSLTDNWKYTGGVDEYVDRSSTAPKRGADQVRPADQLGDADNTVRLPTTSMIFYWKLGMRMVRCSIQAIF